MEQEMILQEATDRQFGNFFIMKLFESDLETGFEGFDLS